MVYGARVWENTANWTVPERFQTVPRRFQPARCAETQGTGRFHDGSGRFHVGKPRETWYTGLACGKQSHMDNATAAPDGTF